MLDTGINDDVACASGEALDIRERVIVSPATGRFHPHPPEIFTSEGEWIEAGQVVGDIDVGDRRVPVVSAFSGWMMGILCIAGQPVRLGEPLYWVSS